MKVFDLDFEVDPLFKKMSAQFDEGRSTSGPFLTSLQFLVSGLILFLILSFLAVDPSVGDNRTGIVKTHFGYEFLWKTLFHSDLSNDHQVLLILLLLNSIELH